MARGTYSGRYATSTALVSVWWVVLDCDQGLRDFPPWSVWNPSFYVAWTTKRHTPALPRFRVAIPLHSPVTVAQHDALLASLMAGYGKHDNFRVHQAAILPVIWFSKGVERHTRRPFRFWGQCRAAAVGGRSCRASQRLLRSQRWWLSPYPPNNTRLSAALKANVVPACRMVGVELSGLVQSAPRRGCFHVKLSCPLGDHEGSASVGTADGFPPVRSDKDLGRLRVCLSHPVATACRTNRCALLVAAVQTRARQIE